MRQPKKLVTRTPSDSDSGLSNAEPKNQPDLARLMTVEAVAAMLSISSRHVYRLADSGRMPRPVKLGGANRWDRDIIEAWIKDGCPSLRHPKNNRRRGA